MIMTDYLRFVLALVVVLGLIALFAWAARRFHLGGLTGAAMNTGRLEVMETLPIDGRQRLILIRRDDREHLLLIGQERSAIVENNIRTLESPPPPVTTATPAVSAA